MLGIGTIAKKVFGTPNDRKIKAVRPLVEQINALEPEFEKLSDDGLKDKTKILVNRVGLDTGQIGLKKAQETIGRDIFWQIPNDYRTMVEVRNNGVPLITQAPKAAITVAIRELAMKLEKDTEADGNSADGDSKPAESKWKKFWPGTAKS